MRVLVAAVLFCSSGVAAAAELSVPVDAPGAGHGSSLSPYRIEQHYPISGTGSVGALAVDAEAERLYLRRSDRVQVTDIRDGKLVGTIPSAAGMAGGGGPGIGSPGPASGDLALAAEIGKGYAGNPQAGSVTVFDLATLAELGTVTVKGRDPDSLLFDAASGNLYTFNGLSRDASVIDPARGVTLATIGLGGPHGAAVEDGAGRVYVDIDDPAQVVAIDSLSSRRIATWLLADCAHPGAIALDKVHHRLFSACSNARLAVTDTDSGRRVATVPLPRDVGSVCFDPERRLIFLADAEGLTLLHEDDPDHYAVTGTVPTHGRAGPVALDSRTHRLYVVAAGTGTGTVEQGGPKDGGLEVLVLGN